MNETFSAEELQSLLKDFCAEAAEHLQSCEQILLEIEKSGRSDRVSLLKNSLHCIKGSSRAVGLATLSSFVHDLESKLPSAMDKQAVDRLLKSVDRVKEAVGLIARGDEASAQKLLKSA